MTNTLTGCVGACFAVSGELKKGGLDRAALRLEKVANMLNGLTIGSDEQIVSTLRSKPYKREIDYLISAVSEGKGLTDTCPTTISYDDWRELLANLHRKLKALKSAAGLR